MHKSVLLLFVLLAGGAHAEWKEAPAGDLQQRQAVGEHLLVVDVRSAEEYAAGHVPGAINLPVDRLTGDEPELKEWKRKPVVIYCRSGRRSAIAAAILEKAGFTRLEHLSGDLQGWEQSGRPLAR